MRFFTPTIALFLCLVTAGASSTHGGPGLSARHNKLARNVVTLSSRGNKNKKCVNRVNKNATVSQLDQGACSDEQRLTAVIRASLDQTMPMQYLHRPSQLRPSLRLPRRRSLLILPPPPLFPNPPRTRASSMFNLTVVPAVQRVRWSTIAVVGYFLTYIRSTNYQTIRT
jgi:hypothetical protein